MQQHYKINVGDFIPSFSALDQEEEVVVSDDLLGNPFVIYFYPKDDTPGCTAEACSFRDNMERLDEQGILVVGVSPDSVSSHKKFMHKHSLNFILIADDSQEVCKRFDVLREKEVGDKKVVGVERTTFIVDATGIIRWIERPVNVEGHVERVLKYLAELPIV